MACIRNVADKDRPGVRRIYPLDGGDYDFVKAQVMGHYGTRRRVGTCAKCNHKGRHIWKILHGIWTVTCCKCKRERMTTSFGFEHLVDTPAFSKWVFPIIKNMCEHDVIDQLVAVQPMNMPTGAAMYMDIITGRTRADRPNVREIPRARRPAPAPAESVYDALYRDALVFADALADILRSGKGNGARPAASRADLRGVLTDPPYGYAAACSDPA